MTVSIQSRILSAILYADIFRYPLTVRELIQWIPSNRPVTSRLIRSEIKELLRTHKVGYTPPFLYVSGHKKTIQFRIDRLTASTRKWQYIRKTAKFLTWIPTIAMVGVTGGLAVNNADKEDDIDLLIIARHHTLWITRFLATIVIELVSKRRHPKDSAVANAVCLNMFLTDRSLQIPKKEHGWYTAHELLQTVPLWQRNAMYTKYLRANRWVQTWFRGKYDVQQQVQVPSCRSGNYRIKWYQALEGPIKKFQMWYMRNRRTTEIISDSIIRFHPKDARIWIRKSFLTKLQHYKVPLDKKYNQI